MYCSEVYVFNGVFCPCWGYCLFQYHILYVKCVMDDSDISDIFTRSSNIWLGHIWYVTAIHNVSVVYIHIHLYIYVQRERLLREAIMVKFCDIIWCHQATMNQNVGTDLKSKTKYTGFVKIFIYVNSYLKSQPVWNTIYRHIDSRICHIRVHIAKYD